MNLRIPDLGALADRSDLRDLVESARAAAVELRWHPAMRRRWRECRLEASAWSAQAMASLGGVQAPIVDFRAALVGKPRWSHERDGAMCAAAVRVCSAAQRFFPNLDGATAQDAPTRAVLARLHAAIGVQPALGLDGPGLVGRPASAAASTRVGQLVDMVDVAPARTPALIVAAVAAAELSADLFAGGNELVAEGYHWVLTVVRGADPTGVAVPALYRAAHPDETRELLARYRAGDDESMVNWVRWCIRSFVAGVAAGTAIADAVVAGAEPAAEQISTI